MGAGTSSDPFPGRIRPPEGGCTADDLDRLPDLPPRTQLIDGVLVFASPQTVFHTRTIRLLEYALLAAAPAGREVWRGMAVRLDLHNRPEPDLVVVDERSDTGPDQTFFLPGDVLLAVEVVSEESRERDRDAKPRKYAAAGIPHFWRVESDEGRPVVYVYELDPATGGYGVAGIHHKVLKLDRPFPVDVELA